MDTNQLLELVKRFDDNKEFISNEETAKMALVVPFIRMLGYDPNLPKEVRLEYSAEFTQGDGKRLPDRMDFAIFDTTGQKPLMVMETKPLGTDLRSKSQQLARYISQMPDLHFGIITDGCHYLLYGDLENPNQMDRNPFFSFSLDDDKTDWSKVAKFLAKFSREAFNAETLITDAENSQYRQAMVDKLVNALKGPANDEGFLKWLTDGVYKGKRTAGVMARLAEVGRDTIEPALMRVISDDFLRKLKARIQTDIPNEKEPSEPTPAEEEAKSEEGSDLEGTRNKVETLQEELDFFQSVKALCVRAGYKEDDFQYRDTLNYFNVSYLRPTKWFVRFFSGGRKTAITTLVPTEETKTLCSGFLVEEAPAGFGKSRIYMDNAAQVWALKDVITRSLEILKKAKDNPNQNEPNNHE